MILRTPEDFVVIGSAAFWRPVPSRSPWWICSSAFIQTNKAFGELVGYSRDELLGMSIMDLTAQQSRLSPADTRPRFWLQARTNALSKTIAAKTEVSFPWS